MSMYDRKKTRFNYAQAAEALTNKRGSTYNMDAVIAGNTYFAPRCSRGALYYYSVIGLLLIVPGKALVLLVSQ